MKKIVQQDMDRIYSGLTEAERARFQNSTILFTGGAGFLGFYFITFLTHFQQELGIKKVICLDNFQVGCPAWLKALSDGGRVELHKFNVITDDIAHVPGAAEADYIYHMASIASPIFYRKYPIETLDANIWGLRRLLDFYCEKPIKGLAFYSSSEIYGYADIQGVRVPIAGIAGDQQAAPFGQTCFQPGDAKNTYGTGCFLLMNTGDQPCESKNGLLTTIAIGLSGRVQYALEGSVFVGGAVIQWLRDELRFFTDSSDAEYYAQKVPDNGGVYLVPAFTGLGAPYWDMYARGAIVGLTRGTKREHIIRAAQESIAYQVADLVGAMSADTGLPLSALKADGGASRDRFLMQFQADIMGREVRRPAIRETTALGAAYLAGLATGVWSGTDEIKRLWKCDNTFQPSMAPEDRELLMAGWRRAVGRSRDWAR